MSTSLAKHTSIMFKNSKNFIYKLVNSPLFALALIIGLILAQHRFWLYSEIYTNLYNKIGSGGDAYYNLAIYLQNNTNLLQGKFYSMDGDHFTWWSNIIAVTGHGWAPSIIFSLFKSLTNNSIAAFNLLFFSNLILTQLGVYLLVRNLTKNQWISGLVALLVPLSQGWNTFYMAHIHASFYWWLPFLVLSTEKIINQKLNFRQLRFWSYLALLIYTVYWYIFGDWHSFVFGSLFLIPYIAFKSKSIFEYIKASRQSFLIICGFIFGIFVSAIPFVLKVIEGSKIFNATRDIGAVNGTNFNTERFLGLKYIFMPIISGITNRFPNSKYIPKLNQIYDALNKTDSMYPDALSIITFWLLIILIIPWTVQLFIKRGKYYPRLYSLAVAILISFFVILGPYLKFGGSTILSSYLPHQLIHTIFYPLQAIRAVWRGAFVGYLGVLIFWAIIFSSAWAKYGSQLAKSLKLTLITIILILTPIFMLIQNNGFTTRALDSYKSDTELNMLLDKATTKNRSYDFYIWRKAMPQDQSPTDYYHYSISERNNNLKYQQINWVVGGTAGTYPLEGGFLDLAHSKKINIPETIQILNQKNVDLILQENDTNPANLEYADKSTDLIYKYWQKVGQTVKYTLWQKQSNFSGVPVSNLKYSLNLSNTQATNTSKNLAVKIENTAGRPWVNPKIVTPIEFEIRTYKGNIEYKNISKSFGEPAFLMNEQGISYQWNNKDILFDTGVDTVKLFRNKQEVYSQKIKTVSNDEYQKLITNAKSQPLQLDNSQIVNFVGNYGLSVAAVHIKSKVLSGGVLTSKQYGKPIISQYIFRPLNSQDKFSNYSMPGYIGQPNCPTEENYLSGDIIDQWCVQYAPQMNLDGYEFKINLQYQK